LPPVTKILYKSFHQVTHYPSEFNNLLPDTDLANLDNIATDVIEDVKIISIACVSLSDSKYAVLQKSKFTSSHQKTTDANAQLNNDNIHIGFKAPDSP